MHGRPTHSTRTAGALLLALLLPLTSAADERPHVLVADLGLHVLGAGYQHTLSDRLALQVALDYHLPWTQNQDVFGISEGLASDLRGGVVRARAFVHPWHAAPTGFWVSPFAQAGVGFADGESGLLWAVGASAGWAWRVAEAFHLAAGAGGQYHASEVPGIRFGRLYPTIDLVAGYAF